MTGRASSCRILAQCLLIVGAVGVIAGSTACAAGPKGAGESASIECRTSPSVLRATNSGNESADLFLWETLASGGFTSQFIGSVAPGTTATFTIGRGFVQASEATNATGVPNQPTNRPETLRYEFFCTGPDRAG